MDAAIQPDGSLVAMRIAINDTDVANLTLYSGYLDFVSDIIPVLDSFPQQGQGQMYPYLPLSSDFGSSTFEVSGQLNNLGKLPFTPTFNATNMVAGQNIQMTAHAPSLPESPNYSAVTTITLMPQTIDGTVTGLSNSGGFTVYTVQLASYDLAPTLAVQPGQATLLSNPSTVVVYADSNTQTLNSVSADTGQTMRFHGLLFNDNGALRMDCDWLGAGVAE
jgi:hypothetical protein